MRFTGSVAALLAAGVAHAQQVLISELSFGYEGRLTPSEAGQLPNYALEGSSTRPQILSNKVILTPVSPGNQRSSIWGQKTLDETEWVADVDMRATGPERGGGNFNIWLAKDGARAVSSSSIYTVGKFEGLALVIDSHGGSGGMLRAFLNDGTTDYGAKSSVDDLAFGHCQYSYRNLGRPSQVKLRQTRDSFKVEIDGRLCFESDKVSLPGGYNFGITAATPDSPDSFEVFKLVVMSDRQAGSANSGSQYKSRQIKPNAGNQAPPAGEPAEAEFMEELPDENPDMFYTSKLQFQDLHNRMQASNHQLTAIYRSVSRHHQLDETRHTEIKNILADIKGDLGKLNQIDDLNNRIGSIEKEMKNLRNDLNKKMRDNERSFKGYLSDHHATLSQTMLDSMPSHRKLFALFVVAQIMLVVGYFLYKRRKNSGPKKYL